MPPISTSVPVEAPLPGDGAAGPFAPPVPTGGGSQSFGLLGPLQLTLDDRPVDVARPLRRAVLAVLVLNLDRTVPVSAMIDLVWGDDPPPAARRSVQVHVCRLRRQFADLGPAARHVALETRPPGYRLRAPEPDVDVLRFRSLCRAARDRPPECSARLLTEALRLWRGPLLADLGELGRRLAPGLEEERLLAIEDRADAEVALGRHRAMLGDLTALVAAYPLRERLAALRMTALHRDGRSAEALVAYEWTRHRLAEEVGAVPGEPLRRLYGRLLHLTG